MPESIAQDYASMCKDAHKQQHAHIKAAVRPKASGCVTEIYSDALLRLSARYSPQAGEMHFSLKRVRMSLPFLLFVLKALKRLSWYCLSNKHTI